MPIQLLILSDFDAQLTDTPALASELRSKHVRLHTLAIGEGAALPAIRDLARATGGTSISQSDPAKWASAAREMARTAGAMAVERDAVDVTFSGQAAGAGVLNVPAWNRAWLRESATALAEARRTGETLPMAARWNAGEGQVLSVAFGMTPERIEPLVHLVARPPHDPRFRVTWDTGPKLRASVDALDGTKYMNGLRVSLELADAFGEGNLVSHPVPQTGPGRYELEVPAPHSPGVASVRAEGQVVGRVAIAGRYAPEFDVVGNDHEAMRELARRTGGQVVPSGRATPLDIRWPRRSFPLASLLAAAGAVSLAFGLGWWRLR